MALFSQYSSPDQSVSAQLRGAAELSLCELEMGIAEPDKAFDTLWEYADALAQEQEYATLIECARKMCELSHEHGLLRQEAVSLVKLGSAYERTGSPDNARRCYERSLAISRRLYDTEPSETAKDDLAVASFRLGMIEYMTSGKTKLVSDAAQLWRSLYEETGVYEYRRRAGAADNLLATPVDLPAESAEQTAPTPAQAPPVRSKRRLAEVFAAAVLTAAVIIELVMMISALVR